MAKLKGRSPRVSRLEADWTRQVLMSSDQWARYTHRVAELKRSGLPIAEARMQAERECTMRPSTTGESDGII